MNYQQRIMDVIRQGEEVTSGQIADRVGVSRNCLLQDLFQLWKAHKLERRQVTRKKGGVGYVYSLPALVPWSDWPAWTRMSIKIRTVSCRIR